MNMQAHILAAMQEQLESWQALLGRLNEAQITTPLEPSDWSIKIVIAHLMTWQQRSFAHFEAALLDREPRFPDWLSGDDPDAPGNADRVNAWVYRTYRDQSWEDLFQAWRDGYLRLIEAAQQIDEINLLAFEKYPWLHGYSLADILISSYDHHKEHYEKLQDWLEQKSHA